jgi:hypothetical protein
MRLFQFRDIGLTTCTAFKRALPKFSSPSRSSVVRTTGRAAGKTPRQAKLLTRDSAPRQGWERLDSGASIRALPVLSNISGSGSKQLPIFPPIICSTGRMVITRTAFKFSAAMYVLVLSLEFQWHCFPTPLLCLMSG